MNCFECKEADVVLWREHNERYKGKKILCKKIKPESSSR